jgi:hypothetical protein
MEKLIRDSDSSYVMRSIHKSAPFARNFIWTFGPALIALLFGGLINTAVQHMQGLNNSRDICFGYLALQLAFLVLFLIVLVRSMKYFISWAQLSVSGLMSVVFFLAVQQQLIQNAICVTKID